MFQGAIRYTDGDVIEVAGIRVRLTVSRRARLISLRVDRARGEVLAIAPHPKRLRSAVAFAHERREWIAEHAAELTAPVRLAPGLELILFGTPCRLARTPGRASLEGPDWERGARIRYRADEAAYSRAIVSLIKREARAWFVPRLAAHCAALEVEVPKLSIADAKTRWGSCTPPEPDCPASMRLSWRLALAPPPVADYVAAHECAHLIHGDHSADFWAVVRRLIGDDRPHRAWLRTEGPRLHAYGA